MGMLLNWYLGICEHENKVFDENISPIFTQSVNMTIYPISIPNQVGRYVVATRDISAHEVILRDEVGVVGPNHDTYPVCMECLLPVDGSFLCPECNLPLCNEACYEKRGYHNAECELLKATPSGFRINVDFDRRKYVLTVGRLEMLA